MTKFRIRKYRINSCLSGILVLFFLFQAGLRTVYTHSHRLADGRIITHTHIYNKKSDSEPLKSHHHSEKQIFLLAGFELQYLSPPSDSEIKQVFDWTELVVQPTLIRFLDFQSVIPVRSPPVNSFS